MSNAALIDLSLESSGATSKDEKLSALSKMKATLEKRIEDADMKIKAAENKKTAAEAEAQKKMKEVKVELARARRKRQEARDLMDEVNYAEANIQKQQ